MQNRVAEIIAAFFAVVALSSTLVAQSQPQQPAGPGIPRPNAPMTGPAGPAPKRDVTGAWAGPGNVTRDPMPPMTPAGEARFKLNKPERMVGLAATNDSFATSCDPLGFPRERFNQAIESRGGMWFEPVPDRMIILMQYQRVWREVWMDGRELPKDVDAKGYPDSRWYGYSIGHWDGDYTFVIDTTGLDERPWLDDAGHVKSKNAHIQERYTRLDQYTLQLIATVDDPKFYTKPWQFLKANYYWTKTQDFQEVFCVPSEATQYRETLVLPAGTGDEAAK